MKNESREFEMELELKARVATRDIDDIMCAARKAVLPAGVERQSQSARCLASTAMNRLRAVAPSCSMMLRAAISGS